MKHAYFKRNDEHERWPLAGGAAEGITNAVVIPALAESATLPHTLDDLAANDAALLAQTLVVVVVNNRAPDDARAADVVDNLQTLAVLDAHEREGLRLAWVDASSPGRELPPKQGVGLARKIGMDHAARLLLEADEAHGLIVSLDADTRVAPGYLRALCDARDAAPMPWGFVVDYAHPLEGTADERAAILCYELFLRFQALGFLHAHPAYGYPAIGSALACTAAAYVNAGGMKKRQAGEDFYFLQALAKAGPIDFVWDTTVLPSGRPSHRVPFGTGRRVQRFLAGGQDEYLAYAPESFALLKTWREAAEQACETGTIPRDEPALTGWLDAQDFDGVWHRLRENSRDGAQMRQQFLRWFDGFRLLKALHHLRDTAVPEQPLFEAMAGLLRMMAIDAPMEVAAIEQDDLDAQVALLVWLRDDARTRFVRAGVGV